MATNSSKYDIKMAVFETKLNSLSKDVTKIKDNHLVHINQKIDNLKTQVNSLDKKIAYYIGGLATLIVVLQLVIPLIIKLIK